MTRTVTIDSTDYSSQVQQDAFSLTECANRGEVGTGGFDVYDASSALTIPALKDITFSESAASPTTIFSGFTHARTTAYIQDAALSARQWSVETTDLNALASDFVLTSADSPDRSSESDYTRITWLLSTVFGTSGSITVGNVPNTNTVTMDASDYDGRYAADVLAECSEAAGKLWFIYDYGSGRKLYYDLASGTALSSTAKISDVAADVDGTTVFAPVGNASIKRSPDRIYSKIYFKYNGGNVTVSNGTTATTYRTREASVLDSSVSDSTLATTKATALLDGAAAELNEIDGLVITMAGADLNTIRAGQRIQIKLTRQGISSYTYYRVIRRTIAPLGAASEAKYQVALGLASDVLASANGSRGGDVIWPNALPGPGTIESLTAFADTIRPVAVVATLPTLPDPLYPQGALVILTSDAKLYRNTDGSTWSKAVDGGDISSRTVAAGSIVADSLTAGEIAAGAIGATEIAAGAVTAGKLAAQSIQAGNFMGDGRNMAPNPSFETAGSATVNTNAPAAPPGWNGYSDPWPSGTQLYHYVSGVPMHSGVNGIVFVQPGSTNLLIESAFVPVVAGRKYTASCWVRGNSGNTGTGHTNLYVRFFTASGTQISSNAIATDDCGTRTTWEQSSGVITADALAAYAKIRIYMGSSAATGDTSYVDDIEFYPADYDINHANGNVVVDSSGVDIKGGYLTLEDEFSKSVLGAAGFSGSWADFVRLGLYNARIQSIKVGALSIGRTSDMPYWTTEQSAGSPVFTGLSGGGMTITFSATGDDAQIFADEVPVIPGSRLEAGVAYKANYASGSMVAYAKIYWYQADGSSSSTPVTQFVLEPLTASVTTLKWVTNSLTVPLDAASAQMMIAAQEDTGHSASNSVSYYGTRLVEQALPIPPGTLVGDNGITAVTPSGTSNDYDPGDIDNLSLLIADPSGANWTVNGLLAPTAKWRRVYLFNQGGSSGYTITLKNENTGSSAANRFKTPSSSNYVLAPLSGCILIYDTTLSRWIVLDT
jgi:hypothetical protein